MIFVGGIHGVGKTYFCSELSRKLNIPHYSSSHLIAEQKKQKFSSVKLESQINKNQDYLFNALKQLDNINFFILNGHFCLLNSKGNITKISKGTFIKLSPKRIIVLIDKPENISKKLFERDNKIYDPNLLKDFQNEELNHAKNIANILEIDFDVIEMYGDIENQLKRIGILN